MSFNTGIQFLPSANCVYVDNDFLALRAKGLLAYKTLLDAIKSWRIGGDAQRKFGTANVNTPGAIILGVGNFDISDGIEATQVEYDIDFVHLRGQGKNVSVIGAFTTAVSSGLIIRAAATHSNFFDFTFRGTGSNTNVAFSAGILSNTFSNVRFDGDSTQQLLVWSDHTGNFFNCEFDFTNKVSGAASPPNQWNGTTLSAKFIGCTFIGNTTIQSVIKFSYTNCAGIFESCIFTGDVTTELVDDASTEFSATFIGCSFFNNVSKGISSLSADNESLLLNCYIKTSDNAISIVPVNTRCRIIACYLTSTGTNKDVIVLNSGSAGIAIHSCRIIGNGSGLAINSVSTLNADISQCVLRRPTGGAAASSISSNVTNNVSTPFNSETNGADF